MKSQLDAELLTWMLQASPEKPLVIWGMPGSGKSSLADYLAKEHGLLACDLDSYLEESLGQTIEQLFREEGEEGFRQREAAALQELRAQKNYQVLALGGGTPCYFGQANLLCQQARCLWLNPSLQVLAKRLWKDKKRPLLANCSTEEALFRKLQVLYEQRKGFYAKAHRQYKG